ncbi:MAG TPA: hypothetical protein VFN67_37460 [Polyangiales bacterium]|nr:hypothetical protein [Polyangiales bacterium]
MPESFHDRQWRTKADATAPDPATRIEQQIAAMLAQLSSIPTPLPFIKPAAGWDTAWDLDPQVMSTPDIAANGWNITLTHAPYTALTRAGDVRWMDHYWAVEAGLGGVPGTTVNYPPAPGTYYSTLLAGRLLIQIPGLIDVSIWRATSNPPSLYTAAAGGGSAGVNMRHLYLSNGAPGSAGVICAYTHDNQPAGQATAPGAAMGVLNTTYGAPAWHFAFDAYASKAGHATGRYMRAMGRPLFGHGSGGGITSTMIDTQHGNGIYANTSRCALRLQSGPPSTAGQPWELCLPYPTAPIEVFYIRRQPHRAAAFW